MFGLGLYNSEHEYSRVVNHDKGLIVEIQSHDVMTGAHPVDIEVVREIMTHVTWKRIMRIEKNFDENVSDVGEKDIISKNVELPHEL